MFCIVQENNLKYSKLILFNPKIKLWISQPQTFQLNNHMQGRNHGENLGSTSVMVGKICPPLVGIGLGYLKI